MWFDKLMVEVRVVRQIHGGTSYSTTYVRLFYMSVCIVVASCFICTLIVPWLRMSLHSYTVV